MNFLKKLENKLNLKDINLPSTYRNYDLNKFIPAFKLMEKKDIIFLELENTQI